VSRASPPRPDHLAAPGLKPGPAPFDRQALAIGLEASALELGLAPTEAQRAQLLDYLALLSRWGQVYNLTAVRDPAQMLTQHLLDSLAVWPALRRHLQARPGVGPAGEGAAAARVLDVGSGAGLPGAVLAIVAPTLAVTCVDAVGKKAGFVRQVAAELGLTNLHAVHARVESLPAQPGDPGFDVVTSRAFASLADFVQASRHRLAAGGVWMAMKGQVPGDEIAGLPATVEVFHVEQLAVPGLQARRCLVWMRRRE
jgi:16S rRNA (guanine527-N7)-methyltransferase